uniref:Uncharacterized protein n=1 Tax=Desertifilum tharense IPPAS B-1220 TaxID=1781255 RepID=A0ACD5GUE3_9CYAN
MVEQGGVDNLVEAIALVEKIGTNSYVYKKAQDEIRKIGRQMLALAEEELEQRRNSSAAINIARRIPASAKLAEEAQDLIILAEVLCGCVARQGGEFGSGDYSSAESDGEASALW